MNLVWTRHVERRMLERGITRQMVVEALQSILMSVPGDSAPVCYIGALQSGDRLKICLSARLDEADEDAKIKVVTVFALTD